MKNFTFKRGNLILPIISLVIFSSIAFGQMKKTNLPSITVTFRVDMTYQFAKGTFNPFSDSLDVPGTMNLWAGSPRMTQGGSSLVYESVYTLDSNTVQQYKYRINRNWATSEFPNGGPNRMYRVPNHNDTITSVYDDYDPGTVPMTFKCHMGYQMKMGRFDKVMDYLDIAGTMNGWGAYDVLFDRGNDSVYVITMNIDTINVTNQTPIEFKFRINGDWNNSEFPNGGPNRIGRVQDTTGGFQNIVDVWYNDQDPNIPVPPMALNVDLQGNLKVNDTLTGSYTYEDVNSDPEGASQYRWFRADSITQVIPDTISGAVSLKYVAVAADSGKYIAFEVTPVAATGIPLIGDPVRKWSSAKVISSLGIHENNSVSIRFYPNPVGDMLYIENLGSIEKIEIYNIVGEKMLSLPDTRTRKISLNTSNLKTGVYLIKFYGHDMGSSTLKFIKN
jgi:Secretion system C-terminal sorting domain